MKKILSILITHYNEDIDTIKRMLDTIAIQQHVDWNEIEVIIGDDGGSHNYKDEDFLKSYPFQVLYYVYDKRGISALRNSLFKIASGEFVQFCDGDDCFASVTGLWQVIRELKLGNIDMLVNEFLCEFRRPENGEVDYMPYAQTGFQFVHAKVARRQFLIDNEIEFREDACIHEDNILFGLTRHYSAPDRIKFNPIPYYIWCHNENSVSRRDPYYIQHTTWSLLMNQSWVIEKLYKKGVLQAVREHVYSIFVDMYYSLCEDKWLEESTKEDRDKIEGIFKFFYDTYKKYADELDENQKKQIEIGQKQTHTMQGLTFETYTWNQWMEHLNDVKPIPFEIKNHN